MGLYRQRPPDQLWPTSLLKWFQNSHPKSTVRLHLIHHRFLKISQDCMAPNFWTNNNDLNERVANLILKLVLKIGQTSQNQELPEPKLYSANSQIRTPNPRDVWYSRSLPFGFPVKITVTPPLAKRFPPKLKEKPVPA